MPFIFRNDLGKLRVGEYYRIIGSQDFTTTITPSATPGYTYSSGTGITNGVSYNVYFFTTSTTTPLTSTYTLNYNCNISNNCFVFAVGGGGSGSSYAGGGGGGGGVVMTPITLPSGSTTITISVGSGGAASAGNALGNKGYSSYVNFSGTASSNNVIAHGGGYGGGSSSGTPPSSGGSSGGGTNNNSGIGNNNNNNFANGTPVFTSNIGGNSAEGGGGGGGGGAGGSPLINTSNGGPGIACTIPGIKDYTPTGKSVLSSYYWGGGGGGSSFTGININGGIGGGGGGSNYATGGSQTGGAGFNNGGAGAISNGVGGSGGANTGGGGGGTWNAASGAGGSGIVAIAFPTSTATSGSTVEFLPNNVTGLILWMDANDPNNTGVQPSNGSTITSWKDKSGGGRNATANTPITYNTTGLNSKPALAFTGTQWLTGSISNTNNTMTIFGVCSMNSSSASSARIIGFSNGAGVHDFNNGGFMGFLRQSNTGIGPYRNGAFTSQNPPSYSKPYLFECWFDGTNEYATVQIGNTTSITSTASSGNFGITYYTICANTATSDGGGPFHGFMSEILVYNTSLSTTDRQKIEGYLSWKWGIQGNLPSTHPFYSSSPTT